MNCTVHTKVKRLVDTQDVRLKSVTFEAPLSKPVICYLRKPKVVIEKYLMGQDNNEMTSFVDDRSHRGHIISTDEVSIDAIYATHCTNKVDPLPFYLLESQLA